MLLSPELKTILIAMSPIVELRGAIPIALKVYKLPVLSAFFLAIIGDLIPTVFILLLIEPISKYLMAKSPFFNKVFSWIFKRTRHHNEKKFERWKKFALTIIVAIPLPFTGAWTGAICAFLFGIPFKYALFLITLGIIGAAIIVTFLSLGAFEVIF
jgi:uncharacterized membrane protein